MLVRSSLRENVGYARYAVFETMLGKEKSTAKRSLIEIPFKCLPTSERTCMLLYLDFYPNHSDSAYYKPLGEEESLPVKCYRPYSMMPSAMVFRVPHFLKRIKTVWHLVKCVRAWIHTTYNLEMLR